MMVSDSGRKSVATGDSDTPIGELPPVGTVPTRMHAQVVRPDRYGDPRDAFQQELIDVPALAVDEVLIAVMAAGVNYNNVWAARGHPVDLVALRQRRGEPEDFHVGGSDASGFVYAVGSEVKSFHIGDKVVVHPGHWPNGSEESAIGGDPMLADAAGIWGYDTNYGSFAQYCRVKEHQVMPKAEHLSWEEAAAPTLVGTTAYRMLFGWEGNTLQAGSAVLVWGGSGGLGTQAIQLVRNAGAVPVAVVSDDERGRYSLEFGAEGYINRRDFDHWGVPPSINDVESQRAWTQSVKKFGKRVRDISGGLDPAIVFEHPGEATVPTSIYVCATGGMVVICAGTTGFHAAVDLRYHWTRQKRLQGSHGTNSDQAILYNDLVRDRQIDPVLGSTIAFGDLPDAHAAMGRGENVFGNVVALVGASRPGLGRE